jgi:hypothetical protein
VEPGGSTGHLQWFDDDYRLRARNGWFVGVSWVLSGPAEQAVATMLATLLDLAPDAMAIVDADAQQAYPVDEPIKPWRLSVNTLDNNMVWLHTHGLLRFGIPNLETYGPASIDMTEAIQSLANHALNEGMPPADEPYGEGLRWLPWESVSWKDDVLRDWMHRRPSAAITR